MPLKAVLAAQVLATTVMTLGPSNIQGDISMTLRCHKVIYKYFNLNNWARYVDKINKQNWI